MERSVGNDSIPEGDLELALIVHTPRATILILLDYSISVAAVGGTRHAVHVA
jgi:hypothetical protein